MAKTLFLGFFLFALNLSGFAAVDFSPNRAWFRADDGNYRLTFMGPMAQKTFGLLNGMEVEMGQAPVGAIVLYRRGKQIQCFASQDQRYSCDITFNSNAEVLAPTADFVSFSIVAAESISVENHLSVLPIQTKPGHWIELTDSTIAERIFTVALTGPEIENFETGPHGHGTFVRQGRDFRCFKTYGLGIQVQFEFNENGVISFR